MRVHLVANPTAGRGRVPDHVRALSARLEARGASVATHWTEGPGDARRHVASLAPGEVDRLVVFGGDGTLHEVVNARERPFPWPVAVVPVGTANLVARDAGMPPPRRTEALAHAIEAGEEWAVDLLETDRGLAVANVGVGIDAEIVRAAAAARRGGPGGYGRWVGPLARAFVGHVPPTLRATVDGGEPIPCAAVVVQNARAYGGPFTLSGEARMDDGLLHVFAIRAGPARDWFRTAVAAFRGVAQSLRHVRVVSGRQVEVRGETSAAVQVDGDPAGETDVTVRVARGALRLLRPPR
jgi:diacylglycerol kinase family enzyme